MLVCGIDEAGRGPVIGPLVMAGVLVEEGDIEKLKAIEVKDSKLVTPKRREMLFKKIINICRDYRILVIEPSEIDNAVNGHDGLNLNRLEAVKTAEIIDSLNPDKAIIDAPSNNIQAYTRYVKGLLNNKEVELVAEHKADVKYPSVSAASILAKVTRDNEIKRIQEKINEPIGSGYPADPITAKFLEHNYDKHPEIFRKSWASHRNAVNKKFQRQLTGFDEFIEQ